MPWLESNLDSGERQLAVGGNSHQANLIDEMKPNVLFFALFE